MSFRKTNIWRDLDWFTVILYVIMVIAGWFSIYGATYEFDNTSMFDLSGRAGMQMVWFGTSVLLIFVILMLNDEVYDVLAYFLYFLVILLLIATIFLAPDIKGSRSWLVLGPIRLQPAEFAKFVTALAVAKTMSQYGFKLLNVRNFLFVCFLIFLPLVLIILQKETGSALVYFAFALVLYREGMTGLILFAGFCAVLFFIVSMKYADVMMGITPLGEFIVSILILGISLLLLHFKQNDRRVFLNAAIGLSVIAIATFIVSYFEPINLALISMGAVILFTLYMLYLAISRWMMRYLLIGFFALGSLAFMFSVDYVFDEILEPHQQIRIKVSLGLEDDPSGAGYNVNQSKIAIGSGGLTGKGFLNGTQTKLKYVPEQDTDFIFCTVGEEQGFVGSAFVLLMFTMLILRIVYLAEQQKSTFNRVYGYSVASIFFFHFAINVGMVTGLTPVIGIPLPFFSYGGSSLWGFTILLFIFLRLDATRAEQF
ncbi:MAG: rod shape-determining protein RodA [Tannerellaceae bacterium]